MHNFRHQPYLLLCFIFIVCIGFGQDTLSIEGFDKVEFHYNANKTAVSRDFRGMAPGYMTAGWWAEEQMKENILSWKTAVVPAKKPTTFSFVAASAVLPSEFSRGPLVKLFVNVKYALTFRIGYVRDFTWKEGEYELRYISKRVEYPYFGSHRQLELNGNSGIYQLSVPASNILAGQPATVKVEMLPFTGRNAGWFMVKERRDSLKETLETLQGEMDALRMDLNTINQQTHILATQLYKDQLDSASMMHQVIYENNLRHLHPADMIKLNNGEMLIMAREASEHYSNDGDVVMLRSKDGGRTWGGRQMIGAIKNMDEREGCGIQLKDGTIIVGVYYNDLYNPDGTYGPFFNWKKQEFEPIKRDSTKPTLGAYIITSNDNGHTWSQPHFIDTKSMPFTNLEGPTDAPIEMPDGSMLWGSSGTILLARQEVRPPS